MRHGLPITLALLGVGVLFHPVSDASESVRQPARSACWSHAAQAWEPCATERSQPRPVAERPDLDEGVRRSRAVPGARRVRRLAPAPSWCPERTVPVLEEQTIVRWGERVLPIAELPAETRACLERVTPASVDPARRVPLEPGVTYYLGTLLGDVAGTVSLTSFGEHVLVLHNGLPVSAPPAAQHLHVTYRPGDVLSVRSVREPLLVSLTFTPDDARGRRRRPERADRSIEPNERSAPAPVATPPVTRTTATGLTPPTEGDRRWMEKNLVRVGAVRFNELGLRRALAGTDATHLPRLPAPVPYGEEVVAAGATVQADPEPDLPLPDAVDNSLLPAFPPIRSQGSLGSCACFASTYYLMTHMTCLVRGCDAKNAPTDEHRFSPAFTYNMINGGSDSGSWITTAFAVMLDHGSPSWESFPYVGNRSDPLNYRRWPTAEADWREAVGYRTHSSGAVYDVDTAAGLDQLKQLLANGYIFNFATYVYSWNFTSFGDDPATAEDDATVGQPVAYVVASAQSGPHGMTIVGYDDRVWTDVNGNGSVDSGEKGALLIANSWGTGWQYGGFAWLAYDALLPASAVAGGPTDRQPALWYDSAYWMTARESYDPSLLAVVDVSHGERNDLYLRSGRAAVGAASPDVLYQTAGLSGDGGAYAFDGTTVATTARFVVDLTDYDQDGTDARWFLQVEDYSGGAAANVAEVTFEAPRARRRATAGGPPTTVDGTQLLLHADLASEPPGDGITNLVDGESVSGWMEPAGSEPGLDLFAVDLPCGAGALTVGLTGLDGDADLVLQHAERGRPVAAGTHAQCAPAASGTTDEQCVIDRPEPGRWWVGVFTAPGSAQVSFSVTASWTATSTPAPVPDLALLDGWSGGGRLAWSQPAVCGERASADHYAVLAGRWAPGLPVDGSLALQEEVTDGAAAITLDAVLPDPTPGSEVVLVRVVPGNASGYGSPVP
jgi:hypothetical protein